MFLWNMRNLAVVFWLILNFIQFIYCSSCLQLSCGKTHLLRCKASFCFIELGTHEVCCAAGFQSFPHTSGCFHCLLGFLFSLLLCHVNHLSNTEIKLWKKVLQEILDSIFEPLASKSCALKDLVSDFKWLVCSVTFIWPVSVSRCFLIGFVFYHIWTILQPSFWSFQDLCI